MMMCDLYSKQRCETWDGTYGANACFVLEPEEIENNLSIIPEDQPVPEKEMRIVNWTENNDDVIASEADAFSDSDKYFELEEEKFETISEETKLGSVPYWLEAPDEMLKDYRFVGQINSLSCGANFGDDGIGYIFLEKTNSKSMPKGFFFFQC